MRVQPVEDVDDARLDPYRNIRDTERRRTSGLFVAESALVVQRLLTRSRFRARSILATPGGVRRLGGSLASAPPDLEVYVGSHGLVHAVLGFKYHRGCLALAERGPEIPPEAVLAPSGPRLVLVLDDLSDPDNVGAAFRSAHAFGVDAVLVSPGTADPLYAKAVRVSVGAVLTVPFARLAGWPASLGLLREHGYRVVALTPEGEAEVSTLGQCCRLPDRLALVVGSEGSGLSAPARAMADATVRVAMAKGVDSLNVAVATAIALHRVFSARR
jgi:tRNA G18 (ribose-2'-O)-methylase SpoU